MLDRAAVPEIVLSHGSVVAEVLACVCDVLMCCGDSCSLSSPFFEFMYCCLGVGVDWDRVRVRFHDEDVVVVVRGGRDGC